jgi:XTP/dITP diphosphohydrolase
MWVVATSNAGKLDEIRTLLGPDVTLRAQSDFGIVPAEEAGQTFVENALAKARHASRLSGMPSIADDSGLLVDALGGAPGVRSARYAGPDASAADNIAKLLEAMRALGPDQRAARFYCVAVALRAPGDPCPILAIGQWHGTISEAARGTRGFGYDPVFYDPVHRLTAAEMPAELKNQVSHRARALARVVQEFGGL